MASLKVSSFLVKNSPAATVGVMDRYGGLPIPIIEIALYSPTASRTTGSRGTGRITVVLGRKTGVRLCGMRCGKRGRLGVVGVGRADGSEGVLCDNFGSGAACGR